MKLFLLLLGGQIGDAQSRASTLLTDSVHLNVLLTLPIACRAGPGLNPASAVAVGALDRLDSPDEASAGAYWAELRGHGGAHTRATLLSPRRAYTKPNDDEDSPTRNKQRCQLAKFKDG